MPMLYAVGKKADFLTLQQEQQPLDFISVGHALLAQLLPAHASEQGKVVSFTPNCSDRLLENK